MAIWEKFGFGRKEAAEGTQSSAAGAAGSPEQATKDMEQVSKAAKKAERLAEPYKGSGKYEELKGELQRAIQTNEKQGTDEAVLDRILNRIIEKRVGAVEPAEGSDMEAPKGTISKEERKLVQALAEQKGNPAALRRLINETISGMGDISSQDAQKISDSLVDSFKKDSTLKSFVDTLKPNDGLAQERLIQQIQNRVGPAVDKAEQAKAA